MKIDADEYDTWVSHPITQLVFAELRELAETRKQLWISKSWEGGECDERALAMLRGQAEGFSFLPNADFKKLFGESE